jgi:hypothetical protein
MELTQIYLARDQKKALQAKARANGTKVAEEVRRAVDAYLAGISREDLGLLDEGTRKAARHLTDMAVELDSINARLDAAFAQLSTKRGGSDPKHKPAAARNQSPKAIASRIRRKPRPTAQAGRRERGAGS